MDARNDHDILIRVETNLSNLTDEVRLLRDGSQARLMKVETDKVDKSQFERFVKEDFGDHEKRLRRAERYLYMGLGVLAVMNFILLMIAAFKK